MLRLVLGMTAAAAALLSAASARTIRVADLFAEGAQAGSVQFAGGALRVAASEPGNGGATPAAETAIMVEQGFIITNLRFNSASGGRLARGDTLLVNDISQRFADVRELTFAGPTVNLRPGGSDPAAFTLEAFDVDPVVAPVPGAAILLLSGLAGLGFAMGRRKPA